MSDFPLTPSQCRRLEQQLRATKDAGVFRRTLAVLEAASGRPVAEIAHLLRTSRPSVYQWVERFHSPGILVLCGTIGAATIRHCGRTNSKRYSLRAWKCLPITLVTKQSNGQPHSCGSTWPAGAARVPRCGPSGASCISKATCGNGRATCSIPTPKPRKKTLDPPRTGASVAALGQAVRG